LAGVEGLAEASVGVAIVNAATTFRPVVIPDTSVFLLWAENLFDATGETCRAPTPRLKRHVAAQSFSSMVGGVSSRRSLTCEYVGLDDDTPLRLDLAANVAFPDGSMTASGLRKESAKGRLVIERIAGKDYTTLSNIRSMRKKCRLEKAPACGSSQQDGTEMGNSLNTPFGSSETEQGSAALASARAKLRRQKQS
jgi:hypothetical protein